MAYLIGSIVLVLALFAGVFALYGSYRRSGAVTQAAVPPTPYNLVALHAGQRGCGACHGDHLAQDLQKIAVPTLPHHGVFETYYAPMRVEDCMPCHGQGSHAFADAIHTIHEGSPAFAAKGGACISCHVTVYSKTNGLQWKLYDDETKYQGMNGLVSTPTPRFVNQAAQPATSTGTVGAP